VPEPVLQTVNIQRSTTPAVPEPYENLASLRASVMALKEAVEMLMAQRGTRHDAAVTWADLLQLGLVKPDQVPK
jgi:hypothetical protein